MLGRPITDWWLLTSWTVLMIAELQVTLTQ